MSSTTDQDYIREVYCRVGDIQLKGSTLLQDTQGDDFESEVRRAAVDGVIAHTLDKNFLTFVKALKIADISCQQAAMVIVAMSSLTERGK